MAFNIKERMAAKRYEKLGSGSFATVWARPGKNAKWVIKTGPINDGWLDFAIIAMSPQWRDNPFVPKIRWLRVVEPRQVGLVVYDGFYVAVIERLDMTVWEAVSQSKEDTCFGGPIARPQREMRDYLANVTTRRHAGQILGPRCVTFLDALKAAFAGTCFDLHTENVMLRGKQYVITDPLGYGVSGPQYETRGTHLSRYQTKTRLAA